VLIEIYNFMLGMTKIELVVLWLENLLMVVLFFLEIHPSHGKLENNTLCVILPQK